MELSTGTRSGRVFVSGEYLPSVLQKAWMELDTGELDTGGSASALQPRAAQQTVLFLKTMSRWAALQGAELPVMQPAVAVSTDKILACQ